MPAWPSRPVDDDLADEVAPAGDPGVEARRLGDEAGVRPHATGDGGDPARAGLLLVGDRADDELAGERRLPREHLGGDHHGRHPALHVARAAAVQAGAAPRGLMGRRGPGRGVARRDDVDVAVEQQAGAVAAAAGEARGKLRAPREVEAVGHLAAAGHDLGAGHPDVDVGAGGAQALGDRGLERRLVAAGARGRVEGDELLGEGDHVVCAALDGLHHGPFLIGHAVKRSMSHRVAATGSPPEASRRRHGAVALHQPPGALQLAGAAQALGDRLELVEQGVQAARGWVRARRCRGRAARPPGRGASGAQRSRRCASCRGRGSGSPASWRSASHATSACGERDRRRPRPPPWSALSGTRSSSVPCRVVRAQLPPPGLAGAGERRRGGPSAELGALLPRAQRGRHALARQQLADRRPQRGEPGVAAGVKRRVGGERGELGQIGAQRVVDRERAVGAADGDVHLQREHELARQRPRRTPSIGARRTAARRSARPRGRRTGACPAPASRAQPVDRRRRASRRASRELPPPPRRSWRTPATRSPPARRAARARSERSSPSSARTRAAAGSRSSVVRVEQHQLLLDADRVIGHAVEQGPPADRGAQPRGVCRDRSDVGIHRRHRARSIAFPGVFDPQRLPPAGRAARDGSGLPPRASRLDLCTGSGILGLAPRCSARAP